MIMRILDQVARKLRERRHLAQCKALLQTPPIARQDDGLVLFSMIGTKVVLPYLLAVKSLHHQLKRGRVAILDDGTLTPADKALLRDQLGDPVIRPMAAVDTGACPKGGCWERLFALLALRDTDYVIQLDSDTVTLGPVPEVEAAITANRSFTLAGGEAEAPLGFLPLPEFVARFYPKGEEGGHIQALFESRILQMPDAASRRYARGCAGFAGFAKGGGGIAAAQEFSRAAKAIAGARWSEWGSEQITSNYLIANEEGATLLPYDRYSNYWNVPWGSNMRFIHFVGAWRYANSSYSDATAKALVLLSKKRVLGPDQPQSSRPTKPLEMVIKPIPVGLPSKAFDRRSYGQRVARIGD
jgi:hypothetical protein